MPFRCLRLPSVHRLGAREPCRGGVSRDRAARSGLLRPAGFRNPRVLAEQPVFPFTGGRAHPKSGRIWLLRFARSLRCDDAGDRPASPCQRDCIYGGGVLRWRGRRRSASAHELGNRGRRWHCAVHGGRQCHRRHSAVPASDPVGRNALPSGFHVGVSRHSAIPAAAHSPD